MNGTENPLSRFDFRSGAQRGSSITLYPAYVTHRGSATLETAPLSALASVRVSFERDVQKIGWGILYMVIAYFIYTVSGPIASLMNSAAGEVVGHVRGDAASGWQSVGGVLKMTFSALETAALKMPLVAAALAAWGLVQFLTGFIGGTTLTLTLAAVEREYRVWGRNSRLMDFAEAVSEQLARTRN